jgi:hypothetical protein
MLRSRPDIVVDSNGLKFMYPCMIMEFEEFTGFKWELNRFAEFALRSFIFLMIK